MGCGGVSVQVPKKGPPLGRSLPGGRPFFVWQWEQEETEATEKKGKKGTGNGGATAGRARKGSEKIEVVVLS